MSDDLWEARIKKALKLSKMPEHTQDAMARYLFDRLPPGSFLESVLKNDLVQSVMRADVMNKAAIKEIAEFVYWYVPIDARGDNYDSWLAARE